MQSNYFTCATVLVFETDCRYKALSSRSLLCVSVMYDYVRICMRVLPLTLTCPT